LVFTGTTLFFIFFSPIGIIAQDAELTVTALNRLNNPASGLASVMGPDTSIEKEPVNRTALLLVDGIKATEDVEVDNRLHRTSPSQKVMLPGMAPWRSPV
jgi:hypothetical protein